MSDGPAPGRFWYVPIKEVVDVGAHDSVVALDEVAQSHLSPFAPNKLYREGVRPGDLLALLDGDAVVALARVLRIDARNQLSWRKLPVLEYPQLPSTPTLSEVPAHVQTKFRIGIDALLCDTHRPVELAGASTAKPSNVILYGPPGTGKTYCVKRRAVELILGEAAAADREAEGRLSETWDELRGGGQVVFCTFHQAFAYEEFVEGLRAQTDDHGDVHYRVEAGIFKRLALNAAAEGLPAGKGSAAERVQRALQDRSPFDFSAARAFVLVIDEINRANIARVFGELITLLEPDKRIGGLDPLIVELPGSKSPFGVPPNLHLIGTMNTADRSIALMDVALRRRFTFEEMMPNAEVLDDVLASRGVSEPLRVFVIRIFKQLNRRLRYLYDRDHQIGHAYFLGVSSLRGLCEVFAERILPLLQEYFFGQWDKVALALGYPLNAEGTPRAYRDDQASAGTILTAERLDEKDVLGFDHDEYVDQVGWDVHPAFRPRGPAPKNERWLAEAFMEVAGEQAREVAATQLMSDLAGTKAP
ncbi:MAG: AAA family ATPase [Myxococcales bacterium]|nr:AAA family ATPase [Myxococcales bacterium]